MEPAKYTALLVAKYFINKGKDETDNGKLTNLKLQKILYYAQGWYLANFNRPLFNDPIQAWRFGPAIHSIYRAFSKYGSLPIREEITADELKDINPHDKTFLDKIWDTYKLYSGTDLIQSTHKERPWMETREDIKRGGSSDTEISLATIKAYFEELKNS